MTDKKLFAKIALWNDPVPRGGPAQMACDEAMLSIVDLPVLRVFLWAQPWISAGFFIPRESARMFRPDLPFCRRWTGGGVVVHEGDFTFSLVVPRHESWALMRPSDTYLFLHEAIARALRQAGVEADLAEEDTGQEQCFIAPVRNDVLANGRKIAGGAQRRTKRGLLHQGSIQGAPISRDFAPLLASHLAHETSPWQPPDELERTAETLVGTKYGNDEFLARGVLTPKSLQPSTQP
jgi:lipoate-protein ligase A